MTYPRVVIRGEDLPAPFDGIDDREYVDDEQAVYYPSLWEFMPECGMVRFEWMNGESEERQRWISLDKIDSLDSYHESEGGA